MSFTNYTETAILGHIFGGTTFSKPTVYIGLFTAAPTDAGGGTEVSGGAYARKLWGGTITSGDPSEAANTSNIEFPTATTSWGTITHVGAFDAASAGNLLAYAALDVSKAVSFGDVFRFNASDLKWTLT